MTVKKDAITNRSRLRCPYPNGNLVECPHCGEQFELKRISETATSCGFECLKCERVFHIKK